MKTRAPEQAYLDELCAALADLPDERRREIVDETRLHIQEAASHNEDVRITLERLGPPTAIAEEAWRRFDIEPRAIPSARDIWTLVTLALGGIVLPVVGWLAGVALLWTSRAWSRREQIVGTCLAPGGLGLPFYLIIWGPSERCGVINGVEQGCTGGASTAYLVFFSVSLVLSVGGLAYLAVKLRARYASA